MAKKKEIYETAADSLAEAGYVEEAVEMLGKGYDHPTVVVEAPKTTISRRNGVMTESDEPAWVKFSTGFKKELKTFDEYALKVFIYIGLSINWISGEAFPGIRRIAKDLDMDKGTVLSSVQWLESNGFLTIYRQAGKSNTYTPTGYFSIGTVRSDRTPNTEVSGENEKVSGDSPVKMHNKIKQDNDIDKRISILAKLYQANITLITPIMAQTLADAAMEFPDETWYEPAFKIAVDNNARNWRYVETCLSNWKKHGRTWRPEGYQEKKTTQPVTPVTVKPQESEPKMISYDKIQSHKPNFKKVIR